MISCYIHLFILATNYKQTSLKQVRKPQPKAHGNRPDRASYDFHEVIKLGINSTLYSEVITRDQHITMGT